MAGFSCDTMVVMRDMTDDGSIIFGKNSDRQPNEPLSTRYIPAATHLPNSKLKATYIEIDQVEKTHSCILFCPTNIFGAEMGFNCHGLVVGNEALFTKIPSHKHGLTGMDLVRLVLERCSTSEQGKNTIIKLLDQYGQGGNCGFTAQFSYHSSFLLVDSIESWIIETVGKDYAAKRITKGAYTMSNQITFGNITTFDEYSPNLIQQAILNKWCKSIEDFHFQKCYSGFSFYPNECYNGFVKTYFSSSYQRKCRANDLINRFSVKSHNDTGQFTRTDMFHVLRDHRNSKISPAHGLTGLDLCMHAGFGPVRLMQTTGSLVSVIPKSTDQIPVHYATCTSLPCLSIYKPLWLDVSSNPPSFISSCDNNLSNPSISFSSNNVWWKSEIMTRNVMKYYKELINQIVTDRNSIEKDIVLQSKVYSSKAISQQKRNLYTISCFDQVDRLTDQWFSRAHSLSLDIKSELSVLHEFAWDRWKKSAKIPNEFLIYSKVNNIQYYFKIFIFIIISILIYNQTIFSDKYNIYFPIIISFVSILLTIKLSFDTKSTTIKLPKLDFDEFN